MTNILISVLFIAGFVIATFVRLDGADSDIRFFNSAALALGCAMVIGAVVWKIRER